MTLDQVCQEAQALTPAAAHMASLMLPLAGPMAAAWQAEIERSLAAAAQGYVPLDPGQIADVLHAALHPDNGAGWLAATPASRAPPQCAAPALWAGKGWTSSAMLLWDKKVGAARH